MSNAMWRAPPTGQGAMHLLLLTLLCAACARAPADAQEGSPREELRRRIGADASERLQHLERAPTPERAATGEVPADVIDSLTADVAAMTGADPARIEVVHAEAVVWSSGALGCPEPDRIYTQAQVPGYHVVLAVGENRYDYRVIDGGPFRLCK